MNTLIKFLFYGLAFIATLLFLIYHLTNSYVDEQLSEMSPDEREQQRVNNAYKKGVMDARRRCNGAINC